MATRRNSNRNSGDASSRYYLSGNPLRPEEEPFFQNEEVVAERFVGKGLVGRGRRTQVFKTNDRITEQAIALKVLAQHTGCDHSTEEMLRQEILKGRLVKDHSHVIQSHDLHTVPTRWGEMLALSMEYADGGSLRTWLDAQKTNYGARTREAPRILIAIARGLAAIHKAGIFLIDLRPENLLFVNGEIKIGDLMLAQAKDSKIRTLDIDPAQRGTPDYMSPEQDSQRGHNGCDSRSDIYAFGIVAYELISRRAEIPRQGPDGARVLEPVELGGLTESLRDLVIRCIASEPKQRPQDGTELLAELKEALQKNTSQNMMKDKLSETSTPYKSAQSPHHSTSQSPPPVPPKYRIEKFPKARSDTSRTSSALRQPPPNPSTDQQKPKPAAATSAATSPAPTEPQYLGIVSDGLKKEAAEVHTGLTMYIDELTLPDLCRFETKANLLPLAPALVQELKNRITVLERTVESLKRQGWQSLLRGDFTHAFGFFQEAEAILLNDRSMDRVHQCMELLITNRKARVQEILRPNSPVDSASRPPTLELSEERIVGYIGVLLGFEEESRWRL